MKISYDPKCEELARWFLEDQYGADYNPTLRTRLAGVIQHTIEDWIDEHRHQRNVQPPDEGEDYSGQGEA
jgi:hypothetical protein